MFEHFVAMIHNWAATTSERQKLQHTYLVLMGVITLVAGVVSFFDAGKGHSVMYVVLVLAVAYLVNALAWNLLKSALLDKIAVPPAARRRK